MLDPSPLVKRRPVLALEARTPHGTLYSAAFPGRRSGLGAQWYRASFGTPGEVAGTANITASYPTTKISEKRLVKRYRASCYAAIAGILLQYKSGAIFLRDLPLLVGHALTFPLLDITPVCHTTSRNIQALTAVDGLDLEILLDGYKLPLLVCPAVTLPLMDSAPVCHTNVTVHVPACCR